MNPLVGSLLPRAERPFGDYELISKLAAGGMAEILLARREVDGKRELVVVKRVLPHLLDESRFIAMFRDEGRLAAQIIHPNVCRVYDSGTVGNTYYIAMEYLHGVPLSRMLIRAARTKKAVDINIAVGIVMQCAQGLHHAHELTSRDGRPLDVVHRDVSPPNILITTEGVAKMLDFGVAKARGATQKTRTGTVKGKNSYMSPEQILGKEVDRRSDVFSLGIVLWESLTAKRLFSRDTDFLTFTAITKTDIPNIQHARPDVSDALAAVVAKALAQDRDERYATAKQFSEALAAAIDNAQVDEEAIGNYIRQAFSKDLADRVALTNNITERLAAIGADEVPELQEEKPASTRASTQPISKAAIQLALANVEEEGAAESDATPTVEVDPLSEPAPPRDRGRTVMAVVIASVVTAAVVLLLSRDRGEANGTSKTREPAAAIVVDAGRALEAARVGADPQTPAAGITDAAPPVAAPPKVDKRPAFLTVDSAPYATIYVDGKKLGVTPIFKAKLAPGPHKLRAVSATGEKKVIKLRLKPGRTKNLGRLSW